MQGLGKAVARRFARAGHLVVLVARKEEKLRRIAEEIAADGGEAVVRPADLRFDDQIGALFDDVASLGRLDAVVFNAGAHHRQAFLEIEPVMFEKVWRLGCRAGFVVGQFAASRIGEIEMPHYFTAGEGERHAHPTVLPGFRLNRAGISGD